MLDPEAILNRLRALARELAEHEPAGWHIQITAKYTQPGRRKPTMTFETEADVVAGGANG